MPPSPTPHNEQGQLQLNQVSQIPIQLLPKYFCLSQKAGISPVGSTGQTDPGPIFHLVSQPLIWKTEVELSGKILDLFQKKEKSLFMSERTLEWSVSGSFVHLHNVGCPFLLSLLHQENISRAQGQPQQEVTTPSQHWCWAQQDAPWPHPVT